MKKRILLAALVMVFAVVLSGGCSDTDEEGIQGIVRDFYSAYNAQDWEACLGHIDDPGNVGASAIRAVLEAGRAATGEVTVVSVTDIKVNGTAATADVKIRYGSSSEDREYPFVKKDGRWKILWE